LPEISGANSLKKLAIGLSLANLNARHGQVSQKKARRHIRFLTLTIVKRHVPFGAFPIPKNESLHAK
jgi:hypothetical protein